MVARVLQHIEGSMSAGNRVTSPSKGKWHIHKFPNNLCLLSPYSLYNMVKRLQVLLEVWKCIHYPFIHNVYHTTCIYITPMCIGGRWMVDGKWGEDVLWEALVVS